MDRRTLRGILAGGALLALALLVPAARADAPKLQPRSLLLRGTPVGESTLQNDINANFFLTKRVLGSQVHVTIAGHKAKVKHVGARSTFYVATLPSSVKLHWSHRYPVAIRACSGGQCSSTTRHALLPKPGL